MHSIFLISWPVYLNITGCWRYFLLKMIADTKIKGYLKYREGLALYQLAKGLPRRSTILEIGCYAGRSTYFLAKGALESGSVVNSIDPFDHDLDAQCKRESIGTACYLAKDAIANKPSRYSVGLSLAALGLSHVVSLIEGYSQDVAWGKPINMLWIDGNHEYENVLGDIDKFTPYLADSGILAFDDGVECCGGIPGVVNAIKKRISGNKAWKLLKIVDGVIVFRKGQPR